jgi:hypothetical protein
MQIGNAFVSVSSLFSTVPFAPPTDHVSPTALTEREPAPKGALDARVLPIVPFISTVIGGRKYFSTDTRNHRGFGPQSLILVIQSLWNMATMLSGTLWMR